MGAAGRRGDRGDTSACTDEGGTQWLSAGAASARESVAKSRAENGRACGVRAVCGRVGIHDWPAWRRCSIGGGARSCALATRRCPASGGPSFLTVILLRVFGSVCLPLSLSALCVSTPRFIMTQARWSRFAVDTRAPKRTAPDFSELAVTVNFVSDTALAPRAPDS